MNKLHEECASCAKAQESGSGSLVAYTCRAASPATVPDGNGMPWATAVWPTVKAGDWCGEWVESCELCLCAVGDDGCGCETDDEPDTAAGAMEPRE